MKTISKNSALKRKDILTTIMIIATVVMAITASDIINFFFLAIMCIFLFVAFRLGIQKLQNKTQCIIKATDKIVDYYNLN